MNGRIVKNNKHITHSAQPSDWGDVQSLASAIANSPSGLGAVIWDGYTGVAIFDRTLS